MSAEQNGTPVLDLITNINATAIEASSLDIQRQALARIAALVAVDAPPASYMMNLGAAGESGVNEEQVQGVLCAIAPIVGTPRIVAAAGNMVRALGLALELSDLAPRDEAG
jgi:alkylhydroperoxidase/carboxymuconolactone decarboxylase family protein YurZ